MFQYGFYVYCKANKNTIFACLVSHSYMRRFVPLVT